MLPLLRKILFVDDEPDIQAIVALALEDIGKLELKVCSSGREVIKEAPEFNPDLFLMDVMMPEMDGPTILRALRNIPQFASTPVIFMTAKVQTYEVTAYKEIGAIDVIVKPFDPIDLATNIRNIWEKHHE